MQVEYVAMADAVTYTDAELLSEFGLTEMPGEPSWLGCAPEAIVAPIVPPDVKLVADMCALLEAAIDKARGIPACAGPLLAALVRHQQAAQRALTIGWVVLGYKLPTLQSSKQDC